MPPRAERAQASDQEKNQRRLPHGSSPKQGHTTSAVSGARRQLRVTEAETFNADIQQSRSTSSKWRGTRKLGTRSSGRSLHQAQHVDKKKNRSNSRREEHGQLQATKSIANCRPEELTRKMAAAIRPQGSSFRKGRTRHGPSSPSLRNERDVEDQTSVLICTRMPLRHSEQRLRLARGPVAFSPQAG